MDELYEKYEKLTINHEPLMAAGIMMAQAMKIYKAMLSDCLLYTSPSPRD